MISKYSLLSSVIALNLMLFTSCLGSSESDIEYSPDAQIYAFSLTSRADTANILDGTAFTIDQVNGRIFNKEPLPYLFHVDSVAVTITGASSFSPFMQVSLTLDPDSTYSWGQTDSVAINRLKTIRTTAQDGKNTKRYDFQLNIYQQDPYILAWERRGDFLVAPPTHQQTIAFNEQFITFYTTETGVHAVATDITDGNNWQAVSGLTGLPSSIRLSSLLSNENVLYALDENGDVYASDDMGVVWNKIDAEQSVIAIFGKLPSATNGNILIAISDGESDHRFATTNDFSQINVLNRIPEGMPLTGFTHTSVENPESFSTRYIVITDGLKKDNSPNTALWIVQEKEGQITYVTKTINAPVTGSRLFYYDNHLYLMGAPQEGVNTLLISSNFGLDWEEVGENQAFPSVFTPRSSASVITDEANNIWIFGGVSQNQTQLVDTWRGKLNKFVTD